VVRATALAGRAVVRKSSEVESFGSSSFYQSRAMLDAVC
jgi:hypothetical protein